ncbi:MAG: acyl CoA--acetate/3-ketoacid CoA transferase subunit alpha [Chloroflexi bacterium]|nr:acyl CoA--acetate/3-ketoacid CoA transferase subunit alpha [Chloroflexota bacterium]
MLDKTMLPRDVVAQIRDGDTIVVGGWGGARRPMALIREIARSSLKNLTVVSFAGMDADLLIGAGKVKKLICPFVSFEGAPGNPGNYRRARQNGAIEMMELSEQLCRLGLKAAEERLPFYPTRCGLGTDLLTVDQGIVTFASPYTGEKLVAMPSLRGHVALIHVNAADRSGYGQILGEPFFDAVIARTADKTFLSAERIVSLGDLKGDPSTVYIGSLWVNGVVEAPYGAHPGDCYPDYDWDGGHLAEYSQAAANEASFNSYLAKYVHNVPDQMAYAKLVAKRLA